jgi:Cof subfamily protein (haloacid dehalogenase superfamily)
MKPYLIALDLDGTLLIEHKTISQETIDYLNYLDSLGHVIVLASGRPQRAVRPFYDLLHLRSPFICYNGALIVDPHDEDFTPLEILESPSMILDFIDYYGIENFRNLFADNDRRVFIYRSDPMFESMFHEEGNEVVYGDFHDTLKEDVNAFVFDVYNPKDMMEKMISYDKEKGIKVRFWDACSNIGEFAYTDHSKADGIEFVRQKFGIEPSHTIAFGDSENDVEMLRSVAYPFVMKNGSKEIVKAIGNVTLDDNEHDGVMKTLRAFFEGEAQNEIN